MNPFEDSMDAASEAVDTWPDWKLDTASLNHRNKRRSRGEVLPKPTKEQTIAVALETIRTLRERNAELIHAPCRGCEVLASEWDRALGELEAARQDSERWDRLEDKVARREVADMLREDPFSSLRDHVDRTLRILDPQYGAPHVTPGGKSDAE